MLIYIALFPPPLKVGSDPLYYKEIPTNIIIKDADLKNSCRITVGVLWYHLRR